jgi:hypothetical protein
VKGHLTLLPVEAYDPDAMKVKDVSKFRSLVLDWDEEVAVFESREKRILNIPLSRISIWNHRLVRDNEVYIIIGMFSKKEEDPKHAPYARVS